MGVSVLIFVLGLIQVPAPAAAHCSEEGRTATLGPFSTCDYNDDMEAVVDELNAASEDGMVYVLVKDMGFHPSVVDVADGGTVTFIYADVEGGDEHDPKSSGTDGNGCSDAHLDPEDCVPVNPGACFAIFDHVQDSLGSNGDTYSLTFDVASDGTVAVSNGILTGTAPVIGEEPFASRFVECPNGSTYAHPIEPGAFVLPYHCGIHGGEQTSQQIMRGTLVLRA